MYLSRVEIDKSRITAKRALASPQVVHALIEGCFLDTDESRKLWRIDELGGRTYLMVLSESLPDYTEVIKQIGVDGGEALIKDYAPFLDRIEEKQEYYFKLEANPTYVPSYGKMAGKKVAHVTIEQQLGWLSAKEKGFELIESGITQTSLKQFTKGKGKHTVTLKKTVFEGVLKVTDKEAFIGVLTQGIGRGRAYGCGLLTVVPVK